ncbi:MAG: hypothetical protein AB7T06_29950 [Kofleriaceae bacterium]
MSALPLLLLTVVACQGGGASTSEKPASRTMIELRDAKGAVLARVTEGRPCRATIDGDELIVGGRPLVMMHGETRWAGDDIDGSTVITRDGESFARIFPATIGNDALDVFDREGVALIRATATGDTAVVRDSGQSIARELSRTAAGIAIKMSSGDAVVTGTQDLLLAAVLSATEVSTEVRALAACHRLLPSQKAAI